MASVKIVHYSTSLSRSAGGLYYSVSGLALAQQKAGAEVTVIGGADSHFAQDRAQWGELKLNPHDLRLGRYGFAPSVFSRLNALAPDIVHIHGIWSAASIYGRAAIAMDLPLVVSPRGMLDPWILARRPRLKALHAALFERPMLKKAHLHALNRTEMQSAIRFMPDLAERIFVLPNGVPDAEPAYPAARAGALYLGRLHEKKQVLELIDAWSANPGLRNHRLTIAGWGEKAFERRVAALADGNANIEFVGPLYDDQKAAALRKAKVFILPSLSEGLPMAVLEALQYGAVPVITDQCNLPDLFAEGAAIRMATDFSDLGAVVTSVLAWDETMLAAHSDKARACARRYLWSNIAGEMLDRYQTILDAKR